MKTNFTRALFVCLMALCGLSAFADEAAAPAPAPTIPLALQVDIAREIAYFNGLRASQDESGSRIQALRAKAAAACGTGYVLDEKQFAELKFSCAPVPAQAPAPASAEAPAE